MLGLRVASSDGCCGSGRHHWRLLALFPVSDCTTSSFAAVQELREHVDDPAFQQRWQEVKRTAKAKSIALIERLTGVPLPNKDAMLDVQVKRIHEVRLPATCC